MCQSNRPIRHSPAMAYGPIVDPGIDSGGIRPLITAEGKPVVRGLTEDQRLTGVQREDAIGVPAAHDNVGESCMELPYRLPLPNGNSHLELKTNRWGTS